MFKLKKIIIPLCFSLIINCPTFTYGEDNNDLNYFPIGEGPASFVNDKLTGNKEDENNDLTKYEVGSSIKSIYKLNHESYKEITKEPVSYEDTRKAIQLREKYITVVKNSAIELLTGRSKVTDILDSVEVKDSVQVTNSSERCLISRPADNCDIVNDEMIEGTMADREALVEHAKSYVGKLTYNNNSPARMSATQADCSSFVGRCYYEALGVILNNKANFPGTAWMREHLPQIKEEELLPGDLIVARCPPGSWGHVVMFAGDGYLVEMCGSEDVRYSKIKTEKSDLAAKYHCQAGQTVTFHRVIQTTK